jgi:hypothetical protein
MARLLPRCCHLHTLSPFPTQQRAMSMACLPPRVCHLHCLSPSAARHFYGPSTPSLVPAARSPPLSSTTFLWSAYSPRFCHVHATLSPLAARHFYGSPTPRFCHLRALSLLAARHFPSTPSLLSPAYTFSLSSVTFLWPIYPLASATCARFLPEQHDISMAPLPHPSICTLFPP